MIRPPRPTGARVSVKRMEGQRYPKYPAIDRRGERRFFISLRYRDRSTRVPECRSVCVPAGRTINSASHCPLFFLLGYTRRGGVVICRDGGPPPRFSKGARLRRPSSGRSQHAAVRGSRPGLPRLRSYGLGGHSKEHRQQRVQLVVYAGDGRRHGAVFGLQHAEPQPQQRAQSRPRFSVALPLRIYRAPIPFISALFFGRFFPPRSAFGKRGGQPLDRPVVGQFDVFREKAGRQLPPASMMRHTLAAVSVTGAPRRTARTSRIPRALLTFHIVIFLSISPLKIRPPRATAVPVRAGRVMSVAKDTVIPLW